MTKLPRPCRTTPIAPSLFIVSIRFVFELQPNDPFEVLRTFIVGQSLNLMLKKNNSALITLTIGPASHADSCQKHHVLPLNSLYSGLEGTSRWHHTYLPPFQSNKRSPERHGAHNKKNRVSKWFSWKLENKDFLCEKNQILSQFQNFACTLHAFFRGRIWMKRMFLEF